MEKAALGVGEGGRWRLITGHSKLRENAHPCGGTTWASWASRVTDRHSGTGHGGLMLVLCEGWSSPCCCVGEEIVS